MAVPIWAALLAVKAVGIGATIVVNRKNARASGPDVATSDVTAKRPTDNLHRSSTPQMWRGRRQKTRPRHPVIIPLDEAGHPENDQDKHS